MARAPKVTLLCGAAALVLSGCAGMAEPGGPPASARSSGPSAVLASPFPAAANGYYGVPLEAPVRRVSFTLTDQHGEAFHFLRQTRDRVTLLFFGYTHCPDVCPATMARIATAIRALPEEVADRVEVVFVTVDPERDTPGVLLDYLMHFDEGFVALTGSREEIDRLQIAVGVPPATREDLGGGEYGMNHYAGVFAFTPDGYAHLAYPFGVEAQMWQHDLSRLVQEGWFEG